MSQYDVITLTAEDKPQVVAVLSESFYQYEVMRYIFDGTEAAGEYETKLNAILGYYFEYCLAHDGVMLGVRENGRVMAVLCAGVPSEPETPASFNQVKRVLLDVIGDEAQARSDFYDQSTHEYDPEQSHYYVDVIGVSLSHQGKGLGRKLLKALHDISQKDPESSGVCLFTENENNARFYQRMGYEILAEFDVVKGLHSWACFRPDTA